MVLSLSCCRQEDNGIRDKLVTGVQPCAFFFQAEDGIRDKLVTGVQTCALPIYLRRQPGRRGLSARPGGAQGLPRQAPGDRRRLPQGGRGGQRLDRKSVV